MPHMPFFVFVTMAELSRVCFMTGFSILLGVDGSDGVWWHFLRCFFSFLVQCCCQKYHLFLFRLYHTAVLNVVFFLFERIVLPVWTYHNFIFCWVYLNQSAFSTKAQKALALLNREIHFGWVRPSMWWGGTGRFVLNSSWSV